MGADRAPFGVFTIDRSLSVRTWPEWLAVATGRPASAVLGRPLTELIPDLAERGLLSAFESVLARGTVEMLAPALHRYLIPCLPSRPSAAFQQMQQRVTIGPLREEGRIVGAVVAIEDVTERLERDREIARRLAELSQGDVATRRDAARALALEPSAEAIAPLTRALGDADVSVRRTAAAGLTVFGDAIVDTLVATIREQHGNFSVLSSALDLLAISQIDVIGPMIACLSDDDVNLRIQAALILGERRDRRAVPALLAALSDPDSNVQFHAIEALGSLDATEAVEPLLRIAEQRDFFLSFPAIQMLARLGDASVAPRLVPLLTDDLLRIPAVEALGALADEAVVPALAALLNDASAPTEVVADALSGLYQRHESRYGAGEHIAELARQSIGGEGTRHLLTAVDRVSGERLRGLARVLSWLSGDAVERALTRLLGHDAVRAQVIEALVRHGAGVVALLIDQLRAEDLDTRRAAAVALGRIGDSRATLPLMAVLEDVDLAVPAATALARIGSSDAFESLLALIGHRDSAIRQAVIAALNSIGHPEMPVRMVALLDAADPIVRESAVKVAGYFGYPQCVDGVLARVADPADGVRRAAAEHLPYFDDPRAAAAIVQLLRDDRVPRVRAAAAAALARVPEAQARPALEQALGDADAWVRYFALRALSTWRRPETAALAIDRLRHDPAGQVRLAAIEALGRLNAAEAIPIVLPLASADDQDVARAAIRALAGVGGGDATNALEDLLRAPEPWRRLAAVAAFAAHGGDRCAPALQWMSVVDQDRDVALAAIDALAQVACGAGPHAPGAVPALLALLEEPARREDVITALAALPPRLAPVVAGGLRHASIDVRRGVVAALGRMKHTQASRALEDALDDTAPLVRTAAITELRRLGSTQAARKLLTMARTDPDADVRYAAVLAMTRRADVPPPRAGDSVTGAAMPSARSQAPPR